LGTITASAAYIGLNTGDPGANGTSNASSTTTREAVTWGSASAGVISASNQPEWTSWAGTNGETVTDISFWSLATSGTFELSMQLSSSVVMDTGDSLTLTSISITLPTAS
jgi:type IV secretory pathway TrbL component